MASSSTGAGSSASSSRPTTPRWIYDVFLSFKGEIRDSFICHLYNALCRKGVHVFLDEKRLETGEEISQALLNAIEGSRISIVVFTKNFAASTWCLDELVKIIQCKEGNGQMVFPVFYKVDPSRIRKVKGSFRKAMAEHRVRFINDKKKVQTWRKTLIMAANMAGLHHTTGNEADLIEKIVEVVLSKLKFVPLHVADNLVGMDLPIQKMKKLLCFESDTVCKVGICGTGGIGKTTLAKAMFNEIADKFEGCSFLPDVGKMFRQLNGPAELQEKLLIQILGDKDLKVGSLDEGINIIKRRLCSKRILVILDDVDDSKQLEALVGKHEQNWFGPGSKIIVTTRNTRLVIGFDGKYDVQLLDPENALRLFSWKAFKQSHPTDGFLPLSERVVGYCDGLPLALEVLGSFLYERDPFEWISALDKLKATPNEKIQKILEISFEGLDDDEKTIFLDVACFYVGSNSVDVIRVLEACGLYPNIGIPILVEKSLITIDGCILQMHSLIEQMGKHIVTQESREPGEMSRLWHPKQVKDVLVGNTGTNRVEGIKLLLPELEMLDIHPQAFENMKKLRLLIVGNAKYFDALGNLPKNLTCIELPRFASSTPPPNLPRALVVLNMRHSLIKQLGDGFKEYVNLKLLNLRGSKFLEEIPDFSTMTNMKELILTGCTNLIKIHESVGSLSKLTNLNFRSCSNLMKLPTCLRLKSLQHLDLTLCSMLEQFPEIIETMESLYTLYLESSGIKELPSSIGNMIKLEHLDLRSCKNLVALPTSIYLLPCLDRISVDGCSRLVMFPADDQGKAKSKQTCSSASFTTAEMISTSIHSVNFPRLRHLELQNCYLSDVNFLETSDAFLSLETLNLAGNNFFRLPPCISKFTSLAVLRLEGCRLLQEIPDLPERVTEVDARGCDSLKQVPDNVFNALLNVKMKKEVFPLRFIDVVLMNTKIPEWYHYKNITDSISFVLSFESCLTLAALAPCVVFKVEQGAGDIEVVYTISINDEPVISSAKQFFSSSSEYFWLHTLSLPFDRMNIRNLNGREHPIHLANKQPLMLNSDQNHFKISFHSHCWSHDSKDWEKDEFVSIRSCGVHLIKAPNTEVAESLISFGISWFSIHHGKIKLKRRILRQTLTG